METYTVVQPIRAESGRTIAAGDTVDLTARQAKWLLLGGKIARRAPAGTKPKTAAAKPKAARKTPEE